MAIVLACIVAGLGVGWIAAGMMAQSCRRPDCSICGLPVGRGCTCDEWPGGLA